MKRKSEDAPDAPASALRGRYLVRDPIGNLFLRVMDGVLRVALPRRRAPRPEPPRRLLIAVGGHLGDAVIATRALASARIRFPSAEIGLLVPSWVRPVVEGHPLARWVHTVEPWKTNRGAGGRMAKYARHWVSARRAVAEIRQVGYDAAIDLYPHFPNSAAVLWRSRIPARFGFASGGLGPLFTRTLEWQDLDRHISDAFGDLLDLLPASGPPVQPRSPQLPEPGEQASRRVDEHLGRASLARGTFAVLHMGAGSTLKMWPRERWVELARAVAARGLTPVFTGAGQAETADASAVLEGSGVGVSFCDRLSWPEFVELVGRAKLVVCTDSVAGHVAAATCVPCVTLMSGVNPPNHWRPLSDAAVVVTNPVPCSPCYRSRGCASMACIREIPISEVLDAVDATLLASEPRGRTVASPSPVAGGYAR